MTKIHFRRSGGILGQDLETDIDLNQLPDAESQEFMQILTQTNFFRIPQNLIYQATPDEYEYTIAVEAGNTQHTVHTSDATAPESLRPLLEKLSSLANENNSGVTGESAE
jgi:hypothetical protein